MNTEIKPLPQLHSLRRLRNASESKETGDLKIGYLSQMKEIRMIINKLEPGMSLFRTCRRIVAEELRDLLS